MIALLAAALLAAAPIDPSQALQRTGPASLHKPGVVARGEVLLSVPVRHGFTGVLTKAVRGADGASIGAGAPVYGLPMGDGLVWCAPHAEAGTWRTVCFPPGGANHRWVAPDSPLFPAMIGFPDAGTPEAEPVEVREGPADLPVMEERYVFRAWSDDWAIVDVLVGLPNAYSPIGAVQLRREEDGSATFRAAGKAARLTPEGDAAKVEEVPLGASAPNT